MVFKINFDGVVKGNLGVFDYGRVYRNSDGDILQISYGSMGFDTNNFVELEGIL